MGVSLSLPYMEPLLRRGWTVYAICPDGPRMAAVEAAGVRHLPLSLTRRLLDPVGDLRSAAEIIAYCREYRFDIVHTHNTKTGLIGRVAAGLARSPTVLHTVHGMLYGEESTWPARIGHASLDFLANRFCDQVFVQSQADVATLEAHHVVFRRQVTRIGNGVSLARFDPDTVDAGAVRAELGVSDDTVLFVTGGRLIRSKGFGELIQAAEICTTVRGAPPIAVAIAGPRDSERADSLTDGDLARGEAAGVHFLGERGDMPSVLAAADVVTLPSWHEGLPRLLMEGASMGKSLLATDVRGCVEVVDGEGGVLVPAREPEKLAAAMLSLAGDPDLRRRQGTYNRRRAMREFDVHAVAATIEAAYDLHLERAR